MESLVGTTKYAGGAGLQKWDKAVLVDLGTGEQPWLKEVYMGELQTPTTDKEAKVTAKKIWQQRPLHEMMKRLAMPKAAQGPLQGRRSGGDEPSGHHRMVHLL